MADISLVTANKINVGTLTVQQETGVAAEAIVAGAPVLFDADGKYINADANGTGTIGVRGIANRTVAAGEALTITRRGLMDGWDLSGTANSYGGGIWVSATAGRLSNTNANTTTDLKVGTVTPLWGQPLGSAADKGLLVEINQDGTSA